MSVAKVVFRNLSKESAAKSKPASVREQRVRTANGGWRTIRTLDAHSPSFDYDLLYVFNKNIAKARRENKRLLGSADGVPRKR
jgi:hypothetical protein